MKGILYGVGVGPGDPGLITLKALDVIKIADIVAVADAGGEKTALSIVSGYLDGHEILYCPCPMTRDEARLAKSRESCADLLCGPLSRGKNIAFCTLGDPSVYSTFGYIQKIVSSRGFCVSVIPGVTSFCAAAAALKTPLCSGEEALLIIPASNESLEKLLALPAAKVVVKPGKQAGKLIETLGSLGLMKNSKVVAKCTMKEETIYESAADLPDEALYLSTVIIKE